MLEVFRMGMGAHACWVEADHSHGENRLPILS